MRRSSAVAALGIAGVLGFMPATSPGFDADPTFKKGTVIFSLQAGGGEDVLVEFGHHALSTRSARPPIAAAASRTSHANDSPRAWAAGSAR